MGYLTRVSSEKKDWDTADPQALTRSSHVVEILCGKTPACRVLFQHQFDKICKYSMIV
jgi:hypothetical protein